MSDIESPVRARNEGIIEAGQAVSEYQNRRMVMAHVMQIWRTNDKRNGAAAKKTMISKPTSSAAPVHRFVLLLVLGMCVVSHGSCGRQSDTLVIILVLLRLPDFSFGPRVDTATVIAWPSTDDGIVVNHVPGSCAVNVRSAFDNCRSSVPMTIWRPPTVISP